MGTIKCTDLCKNYRQKKVLDNVNLTIEEGKIYGLIGRNGAGKTTLLSVISAQNPASSGENILAALILLLLSLSYLRFSIATYNVQRRLLCSYRLCL